MGFEKGHKKLGGRQPATPNKRTLRLIELLEQYGYNPVAELVEWSTIAREEFSRYQELIQNFEIAIEDATNEGRTPPRMPNLSDQGTWAKIGVQAAAQILPYLYPKRKPLEGEAQLTPEAAASMSTEDLIAQAEHHIANFKAVKQ